MTGCAREASHSICAVYSPMQEDDVLRKRIMFPLTKTQALLSLLSLNRSDCVSLLLVHSGLYEGHLGQKWSICCAATASPSGPAQILHR